MDTNYARCKACNTSFYPSWDKYKREFEELCTDCLTEARIAAFSDFDDDDNSFVMGWVEDKLPSSVTDDDELNEGAFGNLGLFER
jgi:hypothetical protein